MSVLVRPARPEELPAAGAVAVAGYQADGLLTRDDGSSDDDYRDQLAGTAARARAAELLVAVEAEQVIGTVTWCPLGSPWRQVARSDDQGEFRMLAVAPTGRRRGAARALVDACLDRARSAGMREVVISSLPEMTPAHGLYRSYGFARAPELDFRPVPQVALWGFRLVLAPV